MNFLDLKSKTDICIFFEFDTSEMDYILSSIDNHYKTFSIKKRNGSKRIIDAPQARLGIFQKKLANEILNIYKPKKSVQAYCLNRSIRSNALRHRKSKFILNIDLKDFFHSITYNRVVGLFKSSPFNFNGEVASILTRLCCYKSRLPQGSPVSPVISNLICRSLDSRMTKLSEEQKCHYTRYADDMTFSTNLKKFPNCFGDFENEKFILSELFSKLIRKENFSINYDKIRLDDFNNRQVVTGLTVNKDVNVNRIYLKKVRAILHAMETFGIERAMKTHFELNGIPVRKDNYQKNINYFLKRIVGKISFIGFVKGQDNSIYKELFKRIKKLFPEAKLSIIHKEVLESDIPIVFTEGKTDWKHIQAAWTYFMTEKGRFLDLKFKLRSYENELNMSDDNLLKFCQHQSHPVYNNKQKIICVFDRDVPNIERDVTSTQQVFKYWGNNLYSMVIPVPNFRTFTQICIEQLYQDKDILKYDPNKRRIYLSTEFDIETGVHKEDSNILYKKRFNKNKVTPKIIDNNVFKDDASIALSKNHFAENVLHKRPPFNIMDFSGFEQLFDNISLILKLNN